MGNRESGVSASEADAKRAAATKHAHVLKGFMDFADALGVPESKLVSWNIPVTPANEQWGE